MWPNNAALVVTSIAAPNTALRELAAGSIANGLRFLVVGDVSSPAKFELDGCHFYSIADQRETSLRLAAVIPEKHYSRKNLGYLLAIRGGAHVIVETDDDNLPMPEFWQPRRRQQLVAHSTGASWVNVYRYFSEANIWPRGLPLDEVLRPARAFDDLPVFVVDAPIQQGLADKNPDVDAIYRLVLPLPISFRADRRVALGTGSWCPFNSQNTTWWPDAYGLLYLPSYCSFRMTDIWRSFVAQRIAWANGWSILFTGSTVWQDRNEHNLLRDFQDEIPGYLHNRLLCEALEGLSIPAGVDQISNGLRKCYEKLVSMNLVDARELDLVDAWNSDLAELAKPWYPVPAE